ncbi:receptor L domain-containing protein [Winogradskyella vidalii]|uniref:hypothetical protein n=1 Tax=Winogradskyella vidalii TaxID=2615024 RepID=UPI0015C6EDB1|nr:hypothetical protein [Winogradskyella vidalii]
MKKTIILLFSILLSITFSSCENDDTINEEEQIQIVCDGDYILKTQQEVNEFGSSGCTDLTGNLIIDDSLDGIYDIVNLEPLNNIMSIAGNLEIGSNNNLTQINAFTNLKTIGQNVTIGSNENITQINGFNELLTIDRNFIIVTNNGLIQINGFNKLATIGYVFRIQQNDNLNEISGFELFRQCWL